MNDGYGTRSECWECATVFESDYDLMQHERRWHPDSLDPIVKPTKKPALQMNTRTALTCGCIIPAESKHDIETTALVCPEHGVVTISALMGDTE